MLSNNFVVLGLVFLFCIAYSSKVQENEKLKVSLYYETLCPFCMQFINNQLYPGYQKIGDYLNVELVPYGNAKRKQVNNIWIVTCQHGPTECIFNKIHACGLAQNLGQNSSLSFVNCIENEIHDGNSDYKAATNKCSRKIGARADKIIKCAEGREGEELTLEYGKKTDAVRPKIPGVPTVLYNDYWNDTLEDYNDNFLVIACKLLNYKPDNCWNADDENVIDNKISSEVLKVSVYYESLCPDSVRFITKQLAPAYPLIGSNLKIDLIPYGKASHQQVNGNWEFTCQHGPLECRGNKLQACGLLTNQTDAKNVDFVSCVMGQWDPSSDNAIKICAPKLGLVNTEDIFKCANNGEGDEILAYYGDLTHAVKPPISFIPTIIFNDVYDANKQFEALMNFLKTACKQFNEKPDGCNSRFQSDWFYY